MGLKVKDFNLNDLKGKEITEMLIHPGHESTVTVQNKDGSTERHRMPSVLVNLLDWYANAA